MMEILLFPISALVSLAFCLYLYWKERKYTMDKKDLVIHLIFIFNFCTIAVFASLLLIFGSLGVLK